MSVLVEQQDETIQAIETAAGGVEKDTEAGYVNRIAKASAIANSLSQSWIHREGRHIGPWRPQKAVDLFHPHSRHPRHRWHRRRCGYRPKQKMITS
jgi:hypothetical protein